MSITEKTKTMLDAVQSVIGITKLEMIENRKACEVVVALNVLSKLKAIELLQVTPDEFYRLTGILLPLMPAEPTQLQGMLIKLCVDRYRDLAYLAWSSDEDLTQELIKKAS